MLRFSSVAQMIHSAICLIADKAKASVKWGSMRRAWGLDLQRRPWYWCTPAPLWLFQDMIQSMNYLPSLTYTLTQDHLVEGLSVFQRRAASQTQCQIHPKHSMAERMPALLAQSIQLKLHVFAVVPTEGTQRWTSQLGEELGVVQPWTPWWIAKPEAFGYQVGCSLKPWGHWSDRVLGNIDSSCLLTSWAWYQNRQESKYLTKLHITVHICLINSLVTEVQWQCNKSLSHLSET